MQATAVNLKIQKFLKHSSSYTEPPTNSPACREDQKSFFMFLKFKWS